MPDDAPFSALVVLRPGPERTLGDRGAVTAETIGDYLPRQEAVETTQGAFRRLGFDVSAVVGPSFSITAPRSRFEEVFGASDDLEQPLDRLPPEVRDLIEAVTFTPPPDFGPTEHR